MLTIVKRGLRFGAVLAGVGAVLYVGAVVVNGTVSAVSAGSAAESDSVATRAQNSLVSRGRAIFRFDTEVENSDVTVVGWAERSFARETCTVTLLAVYNPDAARAFVRGIAAFSLRDNLWLETSAGCCAGRSWIFSAVSRRAISRTRA